MAGFEARLSVFGCQASALRDSPATRAPITTFLRALLAATPRSRSLSAPAGAAGGRAALDAHHAARPVDPGRGEGGASRPIRNVPAGGGGGAAAAVPRAHAAHPAIRRDADQRRAGASVGARQNTNARHGGRAVHRRRSRSARADGASGARNHSGRSLPGDVPVDLRPQALGSRRRRVTLVAEMPRDGARRRS